MHHFLPAAKARLQVASIDETKISINAIADAHSRAASIVDWAEKAFPGFMDLSWDAPALKFFILAAGLMVG